MRLCEKDICTGCNLCKVICPVNCISMKTDNYDNIYPEIDFEKCINCGLCAKLCPQNKAIFLTNFETEVYAAWSRDEILRKNSASGGIAAEIYKYILASNGYSCGVFLNDNLDAKYELIKSDDLVRFQNSKYVFSEMGDIYSRVNEYLKDGYKFIFIGLPCQVAAMRNYVDYKLKAEEKKQNILYVDIICHGVISEKYFKEHVKSILKAESTLEKIKCFFRDPKFGTNNFIFTLTNENKILYRKSVKNTDNYQLCYHNAITYRENCYNCKYAKHERVGDLTIGDFSGYGVVKKDKTSNKNVSCIIINSLKGKLLLDELVKERNIYIEKRPNEEAFNYERQLSAPSLRHQYRNEFLKEYLKNHSFTKSANRILFKMKLKYFLLNISGYFFFRKAVSLFFKKNPEFKKKLKKWCGK